MAFIAGSRHWSRHRRNNTASKRYLVQFVFMENQQEQTQPAAVPFSQVFLEWCRVTTMIILLGTALLSPVGSFYSMASALIVCSLVGVVIGLCGAGILTNARPRELLSRRRFARILGVLLPIFLLLLVSLASGLGLFLVLVGVWNPFTFFLIAGSVLGGDRAAQRMEGKPLPSIMASIFRRG
ncbi:MAG TPA: hypothetical protein VKH81_00635 [Candidatus Angelobacter sp.]|nr:hypothetical protein [Candidatus Angelobacter sp.]